MTRLSNHRSPAEIEREVEETRARLRADLADMRGRLSPGTMVDQALDYARASGGAEFTRNFGRQVRDNPLPIALIGAGIGWLMTAGRGGGTGRDDALDARRMARSTANGAFAEADAARWGIGDTVASAMHAVRDMAGSVGGTAHAAADGVASAAGSMVDRARHAGSRIGDGIASGSRTMHDTGAAAVDGLGRMPQDVERRILRAAEEQPMVLGALGVALGALIGALLPATRLENQAFGDTADRLKEEAAVAMRGGMDGAKAAAHDVADNVAAAVQDLDHAGVRSEDSDDAPAPVADDAAPLRSPLADGQPRPETRRPI